MEKTTLRARRRDGAGTRAARRLRRSGQIPAVIYGASEHPQPIQIDSREFLGLISQGLSENTLITVLLDDEESSDRVAIIREVQRDPIRGELAHIDLVHIDLTREIDVEVPLKLIGTAVGVKQGGVLEHRLYEVEIRCLPTQIPDHFELDVSALGIGDSAHVGDLDLSGYEVLTEPERTIVSIAAPRVLEEVAPAEVVPTEPELVGREKAEEKEEEGEKREKGEKKEKEKEKGEKGA
jgi:large subunit ribosomal protein L25